MILPVVYIKHKAEKNIVQHNQLFLKQMQFNGFLKDRGINPKEIKMKDANGVEHKLSDIVAKFKIETQFDDLIKAIEGAENHSQEKVLIKNPERISEILSAVIFPKTLQKSAKQSSAKLPTGPSEEIATEILDSTKQLDNQMSLLLAQRVATDPANIKPTSSLMIDAKLKQANDLLQKEIFASLILLTKQLIEKICNNFHYWNSQLDGGAAAGENFRVREGNSFKVLGKVPLGIANMNETILTTPLRENKITPSSFFVSEEVILQAATESHLQLFIALIKAAEERNSILNRFRQDGSKNFYTRLTNMKSAIETFLQEMKTKPLYGNEADRKNKLQERMSLISSMKYELQQVGAPIISAPYSFSKLNP